MSLFQGLTTNISTTSAISEHGNDSRGQGKIVVMANRMSRMWLGFGYKKTHS